MNLLRAIILGLLSKIRPRAKVAGWYAGPIVGWKNYSDVTLEPLPGGVLQFELPADGKIDALCKSVSRLPEKLTIRYEMHGLMAAYEAITAPLISVCFQRRWDSWTGEGRYQQYRWYAREAHALHSGDNELTVNFGDWYWTDASGDPAGRHAEMYEQARAKAGTIYITFGHQSGRSHGVGGPATFKLLAVE